MLPHLSFRRLAVFGFTVAAAGPHSLPEPPRPSATSIEDLAKTAHQTGDVKDLANYSSALLTRSWPEFAKRPIWRIKEADSAEQEQQAAAARVGRQFSGIDGLVHQKAYASYVGKNVPGLGSSYAGLTLSYAPEGKLLDVTVLMPKTQPECAILSPDMRRFNHLRALDVNYHELGHLAGLMLGTSAIAKSNAPYARYLDEHQVVAVAALMMLKRPEPDIRAYYEQQIIAQSAHTPTDPDRKLENAISPTLKATLAWQKQNADKLAKMELREIYQQAALLAQPLTETEHKRERAKKTCPRVDSAALAAAENELAARNPWRTPAWQGMRWTQINLGNAGQLEDLRQAYERTALPHCPAFQEQLAAQFAPTPPAKRPLEISRPSC
jgi:hypothetical protein